MLSLEWRYTVKKDKEGWKRKQMEKKESWLEKKASKICGLNKKTVSLQRQNQNGCFDRKIGIWCNGNTTDSGPVFPGSNPGIPTHKPLIKDKVLLKLQF
mgnify:CR=1 FL=1